jgi:hypothetical protein
LFSVSKGDKKQVVIEFCVDRLKTMPPRGRQERAMPNPVVEREMREICARLDAMETTQRHIVDVGDVSEAERENEAGAKEEVVVKYATEEHLFRVVARIGAREKWIS